uniref:Transposable element Tc3 transposase n=1 Tax=Cacopsylla melanoneura TaxID=428564 RepID=A0A8D8TNF6_9HEMI
MVNEFLLPQLDELGLENMWFQQDGATTHTARATIDLLKQAFPGRLISRFGDIHFSARSPDLTVPDFFLWGFLKSRVYVNRPQTLDALKENICQEGENLSVDVLKKVMENALKRGQHCIDAGGGHLLDIIFAN